MSHFGDVAFSQGTVGIIAVVLGIVGLVVVWPLFALQSGAAEKLPRSKGQYGSYRKRLVAYLHHAEDLYREGYQNFKEEIYRMTTTDGTLRGLVMQPQTSGTDVRQESVSWFPTGTLTSSRPSRKRRSATRRP